MSTEKDYKQLECEEQVLKEKIEDRELQEGELTEEMQLNEGE